MYNIEISQTKSTHHACRETSHSPIHNVVYVAGSASVESK